MTDANNNNTSGAAYKKEKPEVELKIEAPAHHNIPPNIEQNLQNIQNLMKSMGLGREKQEVNCFVAACCYVIEFIFYPPINLIIYLLSMILMAIVGIIFSALLTILIPFFPIYLILCCCGDSAKALGIVLCSLAAGSIFLIVVFAISLALAPFSALYAFFKTYYFIFTGEVSPYYSFASNWEVMLRGLKVQTEYVKKQMESAKNKVKSKN